MVSEDHVLAIYLGTFLRLVCTNITSPPPAVHPQSPQIPTPSLSLDIHPLSSSHQPILSLERDTLVCLIFPFAHGEPVGKKQDTPFIHN